MQSNCKYCGEIITSFPSIKRVFCSRKCKGLWMKVNWIPPNKNKKGWINLGSFKIGHSVSKKIRSRISKTLAGRSTGRKGISPSLETKKKISLSLRGSKSSLWIDGRSKLSTLIRRCYMYKNWRMRVFKRDNFTCRECFRKGIYLEPHHTKPFKEILDEFLKKYSQFSPIEDKETLVRLSFTYEDFWNVNYGKTLCSDCHNLTKKNPCQRN